MTVPDTPRSIDPEALLAHTGWMRSLARGLVADEATAEDLVQEACAAALARPPRDPAALGGWLARVVRNLAARGHRETARRDRRERRVARPEAADAGLDEVVERAELLGEVMRAVLALDEPFRSTVLLRYHEGLAPEQVARRLGIPLATVGTRLHRALAELRARLDRERGGRRAWVALLAPWAGIAAAAAATAAGAGTAHAATSAPTAAASAVSGAATAAAPALSNALTATGAQALFGGIIVMNKSLVAGAIAGAICAAIGFGVGRETAPPAAPAEGERIVPLAEYESLVERGKSSEESLAALRAERDALAIEKEQLSARATRAEESLAAARASEATAAAAAAEPTETSLIVAFGSWGELPEIRDADWNELAGAVVAINDLVQPLLDDIEAGRAPSPTFQRDIQEQNQKLVRYGVGLIEKIPSNAPMAVNGEFTHPINLINFIAAILENAGVPLDERQRREIAAIGAAFDGEFAAANGAYTESTWELTKIVDELSLKRDTMLEVERRLTPAQLEIVAVPRIQNRIRLDTLSPVNMVIMNVGALVVDSRPELRGELVEGLVEMLGLPREGIDAHPELLDRFEQEIEPVLEPVARETAMFLHLDDIILVGRAFERYLASLAPLLEVSDEVRASLSEVQSWAVPQIAAAPAPATP